MIEQSQSLGVCQDERARLLAVFEGMVTGIDAHLAADKLPVEDFARLELVAAHITALEAELHNRIESILRSIQ